MGLLTFHSTDFAPPASFSFAPPPLSPPPTAVSAAAATPAAPIPDDTTGDDAYARRLAMSKHQDEFVSRLGTSQPAQATFPPPPPPPPPGFGETPPPPPPPTEVGVISWTAVRHEQPPPVSSEAAPPLPLPTGEVGVISRAAVRYEQPPPAENTNNKAAAMDLEEDRDEEMGDYDNYAPPPIGFTTSKDQEESTEQEQEQPRSNRPGQADFAARLMSKYGWTKGSGLGADGSGITSALRVKVEKRRKKPDSEGGGFAEPGGRGKIIGGTPAKKNTGENEGGGKFGKMSNVLVLGNMLANMTDDELEAEIQSGELKQEVGQDCGDKYGRIEKISIDPADRRVFIKFTDQVSALRAINDLSGCVFNGNAIAARFFDPDEFESLQGVFR